MLKLKGGLRDCAIGGEMRSYVLFLAGLQLAVSPMLGGLTSIALLPNQPTVSGLQSDAAGNFYIGGSVPAAQPSTQNDADAFVAKLSSDGATVEFWTVLSGSGFEIVKALTLAGDGSILVTGSTSSADFPVTLNAAEPRNTAGVGNSTGFFARLDAKGNVVYASYLNGSSLAPRQFSVTPSAIATDSAGAAYITGSGVLNSTPGALPAVNYFGSGFFVVKLDAYGKTVFATGAVGGTSIALDIQGSIYIAGSERSGYPVPVTPGAFQLTTVDSICGETGGGASPGFGVNCFHQYVVKLNPTATSLIYGTWLSGSSGATPAGLLVDGQGDAILAGSTESTDYPATSGAFQTVSFAASPPFSNVQFPFAFARSFPGPPATGYVTKLNATGSALVFSTFLGGSGEDSIASLAMDKVGNINLAGIASSADFPGLTPAPEFCRPSYLYPTPFVTRLSADGSSLTESQLAYGLVPTGSGTVLAVLGGQAEASVLVGKSIAFLDLLAAPTGFACATDSADMAPLAQIAPGQLLSLFGTGIGANPSVMSQAPNGHLPTTAGNTAVSFNGIAAPILYSSPDQINVQVPYEIASQSSAKMAISGGSAAGSRSFAVVPAQPSSFVIPGYATCQGTVTNYQLPVALNADGSLNGCDNPAAVGSIVTLFVNGLGLAGGAPSTGVIASPPGAPLNAPVAVTGDQTLVTLVSAGSDPGSVNGVWMVQIRITQAVPQPNSSVAPALIMLTIGGVQVRDPLVIWTTP